MATATKTSHKVFTVCWFDVAAPLGALTKGQKSKLFAGSTRNTWFHTQVEWAFVILCYSHLIGDGAIVIQLCNHEWQFLWRMLLSPPFVKWVGSGDTIMVFMCIPLFRRPAWSRMNCAVCSHCFSSNSWRLLGGTVDGALKSKMKENKKYEE